MVEKYGERGFFSAEGHPQRIADQQQIHAGFVQDLRRVVVVRREHRRLVAGVFHRLERPNRDAFAAHASGAFFLLTKNRRELTVSLDGFAIFRQVEKCPATFTQH